MERGFESYRTSGGGERVEYDDGFRAPEAAVVPVAHGADEALVEATRRVLAVAARGTGREIDWLRVPVGPGATDRHGTPLPAETVRAIEHCRVGLLGPLADSQTEARRIETDLRDRLGITAAVERHSTLEWLPSPLRGAGSLDVTVFRNITEDAAAGLEYAPGRPETDAFRSFLLESNDGREAVTGPTGYSVNPISKSATEDLVDAALDYAFDRDRNSFTVVHQGDLRTGSEGAFREWTREYLKNEYDDGTVTEETFLTEHDGVYPEDDVVIRERRTDQLCRELLVDSSEYDVVVAPALGGTYVSAVAAAAAGTTGAGADVGLGDGRLVVSARATDTGIETNPIPLILAGCLFFEYLGWMDAAGIVRRAVSATLAEGLMPGAVHRLTERGTPVPPGEFADAVIAQLNDPDRASGVGGVRTSPTERGAIKATIAGVYNVLFEDHLDPADIELNQLLCEDEEADVYLPAVGINFGDWRRFPVERRLEVLLHEFAHVEEAPEERDHGEEFYDRFVGLVDDAADRASELETVFDAEIDFDRVRRFVVESIHEETIEPDRERVLDRKRWLRHRLGLDVTDHY